MRLELADCSRHSPTMSTQVTSNIARQAKGAIDSILKASDAAIAPIKKQKQKRNPRPEHGQQIFVFKHLQKNHVVYSLTKQLNVRSPLPVPPIDILKAVTLTLPPEQRLPPPTPLQRQKNRPRRPPQRPLAPVRADLIPARQGHRWALRLPEAARVPPEARTRMGR